MEEYIEKQKILNFCKSVVDKEFVGAFNAFAAYVNTLPTIKTKQIKYYDEDENVWKVGSVIVNDSEKPNNLSEFPTGSADTQTYITEDRDTQILDAWQVKHAQSGKE